MADDPLPVERDAAIKDRPHLANGMIDVTPTGDFIAITNKNATDSPLLQLPAELRNCIWHYVVGGQTIRPYLPSTEHIGEDEKKKLASNSWRPDKHRFSLLRVSRQIYTEAAILPHALSTFSFIGLSDFSAWTKGMPQWRLDIIEHIRSLKSTARRLSRAILCR